MCSYTYNLQTAITQNTSSMAHAAWVASAGDSLLVRPLNEVQTVQESAENAGVASIVQTFLKDIVSITC